MSEPISVLPEVCHVPYSPGLPRSTAPARKFPPLKRRTQFSPPLPWDAAAFAAYAKTIPKQVGEGDGKPRRDRNFWRERLKPLAVGQSIVEQVNASRAGPALYFWGQRLGRVFRAETESTGIRITRVE